MDTSFQERTPGWSTNRKETNSVHFSLLTSVPVRMLLTCQDGRNQSWIKRGRCTYTVPQGGSSLNSFSGKLLLGIKEWPPLGRRWRWNIVMDVSPTDISEMNPVLFETHLNGILFFFGIGERGPSEVYSRTSVNISSSYKITDRSIQAWFPENA